MKPITVLYALESKGTYPLNASVIQAILMKENWIAHVFSYCIQECNANCKTCETDASNCTECLGDRL
jgi:hypothetical protein